MEECISDIVIREFRRGDRERVNAFFDQMSGETRAFFNVDDENRKVAMKFFDGSPEHTVFFLAEHHGTMVGYLTLFHVDTLIPWLTIAVSEELKGKKLGGRLMEFIIEYARQKGMGGILLTTLSANIRAQSLYKRCGFDYMGTYMNGEQLHLLTFKRPSKNAGS